MLFMMDGVKDRMKKVTEDKENRCALIYLRKHVVPSLIIGVPNIAVGMILAVKAIICRHRKDHLRAVH
jgi:hypothetical protein